MMTKKQQHEFFLKEIQPYVDKKVKEAKQEEAKEIFEEIYPLILFVDRDAHIEFDRLKQKRSK